jgi:inorganic triphosphatase YgiF
METELRFSLSPEARRAIEEVVGRTGDTIRHDDVSTYFDTPDLRLHKAGFSLRVRRRSDRNACIQTVKAAGDSNLRRHEWEWPVEGETPDLGVLDQVPGLPPVLDGHGDALRPLFRTEVEREQQTMHPSPGTSLEVAVDQGVIVAGERRERLSELEIELKDGAEEALLRLGLELTRAVPLSMLMESKAERGYRLHDGEQPAAHQAAGIDLAGDVGAGEAFCRLVDSLLAHLLANQPAALRGDETEGVHQMRVAVRRLRSLLMLFAPMVERRSTEHFEDELRRLGDVLGRARDWDVFQDETLPALSEDGIPIEAIELMHAAAGDRRHAAHQDAKKAIAEPGFGRFVLALRAWSRPGGGAIKARQSGRRLSKLAPRLLDRLERKLGRRLDRADADDAPSLHAVRKSAKKLRYGIEYLAGLYGRETRRYLRRCNRLQKRLGALNDLETATVRARELADERIDLAPALGLLESWAAEQREPLVRRAVKAERAFVRTAVFWR